MSSLAGFLKQNTLEPEMINFVASKRMVDENGAPLKWKIRSLSATEDEEIRRYCAKRVQVPGKRGQYQKETDGNMYLGRLAAACTVFPNLLDAELQNSYGVTGDDALLKAMLTAGEYADYCAKVQEVCGFDAEAEVEEAKN